MRLATLAAFAVCSLIVVRAHNNVLSCFEKRDPGPCRAAIPRWSFNSEKGECQPFSYGGCGGNANNFETKELCEELCEPKFEDICSLGPDVGPCKAAILRYFFNSEEGECQPFSYGGCGGNANNFETKELCEELCDPKFEDICSLSPDAGPCEAAIPRWFFNSNKGECEQFTFGGCEGNENSFATRLECQRACRKGCKFAQCFEDPCRAKTCRAFPEATCVANICKGCDADFFVNGRLVDCGASNDKFCQRENKKCRNPEAAPYFDEYFTQHFTNPSILSCCSGLACCACGPPVVQEGFRPPQFGVCQTACLCPKG